MRVTIRDARPRDIVYLVDCDLKCFDENWGAAEWGLMGETCGCKVALVKGMIVGFVVYEHLRDSGTIYIHKIGVKKPYRRRGIGRRMIAIVESFADLMNELTIETTVPEYMVAPGEEIDATGFLSSVGFKASGYVQESFELAGEQYEAVQFLKTLTTDSRCSI